ncbi:GIY-YIG nuclease family protein [Paenibacillus sp. V4I7]|uniref:GIY-YIG nuclease family protein n=1 Tax=Paenibacillus sp. V4I7 TaxID=3042307 RepID=UPI0027874BA3|nr:GIY-YIG nuclease family protein [Paenibacillus sp. V4I7]MDQ0902339.1 hypothetical protein [Paenibacillus sp. V4I7]
MDNHPKTIQIFLPDGSPRSIKIAEITSRTIQAIYIPRNKLKETESRNEIKNVGVYFLFGDSDDRLKPVVYVGEAEDCYHRLKQHNQNKDFWNAAIVLISKTNSFTKSHVKFLEWHCYTKAIENNRYIIDNSTIPTKSFITEAMEADLMDSYETAKILIATLGFPIFEGLANSIDKSEALICKGKDAYSEGQYTDEGLVVFKGSKANLTETPTAGPWIVGMRQKLIESGILRRNELVLVFTQDHIFASPSAAAGVILARRSNGWIDWKDRNGKTLDEIKRK